MKIVPDRIVVGPYGHCLEPGYTEINGVRFYPERLVVGPYGLPVIEPSRIEMPRTKPDGEV